MHFVNGGSLSHSNSKKNDHSFPEQVLKRSTHLPPGVKIIKIIRSVGLLDLSNVILEKGYHSTLN